MIVKALAALSLALACVSATDTNIAPWRNPAVVRVDCTYGAGTAFRVGPTMLLSVAHVTSLGGCTIKGKPFKILNTRGDFAEIEVADADHNWLPIDCDGFQRGRKYEAIGYAWGLATQTTVDLEATGEIASNGQSQLTGTFTVIPGMSGGPIVDMETGKVVGTVNTYSPQDGGSGSIALMPTPVCKNA